jgi:hypothetical protein
MLHTSKCTSWDALDHQWLVALYKKIPNFHSTIFTCDVKHTRAEQWPCPTSQCGTRPSPQDWNILNETSIQQCYIMAWLLLFGTFVNCNNKNLTYTSTANRLYTLMVSFQIARTLPPTLSIKSLLNGERDKADIGPSWTSPHDWNMRATRKVVVNKISVLN